MERERELPTDDASMELEGGGSVGDVKVSDSLLTLKRSWSDETMTASSDERLVPSGLCSDAIHLDLLVQKGLIEYDLLDQNTGEDDAGDYPRRLYNSSDLGGIAEIVKEMRSEFIDSLSSNVKGLKGNLIKGMMEQGEGSSVLQDHNSELANVAKNVSEVKLKVPKPNIDNDSPREKLLTKDVNGGDQIIQLIGNINQFTSEIERDPDSVDWTQFRANLLKIHRYYVGNPASGGHSQIGVPTFGINSSLSDLRSHARHLRRNIRGLESKMIVLDQSFEGFCDKFRRSVVSKEHAEHDMVVLSTMRGRISQKLSKLENEFRQAREQLFSGAEERKQPVHPSPNCEV